MDLGSLFLVLSSILLVVYLLWYFFYADANFSLALAEKFGRPVSDYRGKVVWMTGASSGLGEAMAYELASVGAKLILTARNKTRLVQVKNKCVEMSQGQLDSIDILVLPFDITDYDIHKAKVDEALKHFGQIDLLVNNAGRCQTGRPIYTDLEVVKDMFEVNFFGAISLTKFVLKHFLDRGTGRVAVISSLSGKFASPGVTIYAATKHALHGYYESLRLEHYKDNIHVTMVCPGFFKSEIGSCLMSEKKGETTKLSIPGEYEMETSRCAHLALVAAANQLYEVWIAVQPFLFLTWCSQHIPDMWTRFLLKVVCTEQRIEEIHKGKVPRDFSFWKLTFSR